jgi:hypothetical protein
MFDRAPPAGGAAPAGGGGVAPGVRFERQVAGPAIIELHPLCPRFGNVRTWATKDRH